MFWLFVSLGHRSKSFRSRHTCAICTKRHPTLFHDYGVKPTSAFAAADSLSATSLQGADATVLVCAGSSSATTVHGNTGVSVAADSSSATILHNNGRVLLGNTKTHNRATTLILPVVVSHRSSEESLAVYALLDTQSDTHFNSKRLHPC